MCGWNHFVDFVSALANQGPSLYKAANYVPQEFALQLYFDLRDKNESKNPHILDPLMMQRFSTFHIERSGVPI